MLQALSHLRTSTYASPLPWLACPTFCPAVHLLDVSLKYHLLERLSLTLVPLQIKYVLLFSHSISLLSLVWSQFNYMIISISLLSYILPSQNYKFCEVRNHQVFILSAPSTVSGTKKSLYTYLTDWQWLNEWICILQITAKPLGGKYTHYTDICTGTAYGWHT